MHSGRCAGAWSAIPGVHSRPRMNPSASASPISARSPEPHAPVESRRCHSACAGRRGHRESTRPPPWAAAPWQPESRRARPGTPASSHRPQTSCRGRLDLDEREGTALELGGGRMARRAVARAMRPVGHEVDPAGVIHPDLARDQGVLAAQPRPDLLGKLGGHLAAVLFPLHGSHSPLM